MAQAEVIQPEQFFDAVDVPTPHVDIGSLEPSDSLPKQPDSPPMKRLPSHRRPLPLIASGFSKLATALEETGEPVATEPFTEACGHISVLFELLGVAFAFGGKDYIDKVKDLKEAAKDYKTLPAMVDEDVKNGTVRKPGSHTRNLLRVKRGLELNRLMFQMLLEDSSQSLKDCASKAYDQVFAPYHSWTIRKLVATGMFALPSKEQFLKRLQEDSTTWVVYAKTYVEASGPIIENVEALFSDRNLAIDW
eukprot:TRINITY_DN2714_c0_g1_i1.p1 TRINITY_DN2714_c0_g1~~TRINITY_DN2714_c0_g1_i1.p1  ORF type:complete len:249 (-),score=38.02 TRINITY_DN2714_c0_g1_i1:60-806(-)